HVLHHEVGIAGNVLAHVAGEQPAIGVVAAGGVRADDERDRSALVKRLVCCPGRRNEGGRPHGQRRPRSESQPHDVMITSVQGSANTNSMVAFDWFFISGERASLARATLLRPDAIAMYCLPSTA